MQTLREIKGGAISYFSFSDFDWLKRKFDSGNATAVGIMIDLIVYNIM